MDKERCCKIVRILPEKEIKILKDCLSSLDIDHSDIMAEVSSYCNCSDCISFGYSFYCKNLEKIKEFISKDDNL